MAKTKNRKPDFNVYMVSGGGKDRKGFWTKIGAAWRHEDGEGFNVSLEAFPTNGQTGHPGAEGEGTTPRNNAAGAAFGRPFAFQHKEFFRRYDHVKDQAAI